jgi:hypothetical protein
VVPREDQQIVVVRQEQPAYEDFWFLSLENLRRHLDGKPPVRCDYSQSMLGDIHHTIEIDAPPEAVYETLIKPEQLNRWIASNASVEPQIGGNYDLVLAPVPPKFWSWCLMNVSGSACQRKGKSSPGHSKDRAEKPV